MGEKVDHREVQNIKEKGRPAESAEKGRQPVLHAFQGIEQQQGRPQRHTQIQQGRRILGSIQKGKNGEGEAPPLKIPGARVAVMIDKAQQEKNLDQGQPGYTQKLPAARRFPAHHLSQAVAEGHHAYPGYERINGQQAEGIRNGDPAFTLVEDLPQPAQAAPGLRADAVQQVVAGHHGDANGEDQPFWQPGQQPQRDHPPADGPDDLQDEKTCPARPGEQDARADHRQLGEEQPQAAAEQEAAQLLRAGLAVVEVGARARKKDEHRRTEMGDPAGKKPGGSGLGQVGGGERGGRPEEAHMVQRHQYDNGAAKHVDTPEAAARLGEVRLYERQVDIPGHWNVSHLVRRQRCGL